MTRPHSQLAFHDLMPESGETLVTLVALHGDRGSGDDLLPLARSIIPSARIVAPLAARGVYHGVTLVSRTWFGGSLAQPEPASFGDSVAQLERFVVDVYDRRQSARDGRPLLLGYDQGAVLALAAAKLFPDLLSGVIAIAGALPAFRDWGHEPVSAPGLPVLIVIDEADQATKTRAEATARELMGQQATVRLVAVSAARSLGSEVCNVVQDWMLRIAPSHHPPPSPDR